MKVIVVDLELTQVIDRPAQIIQIGAVLINTQTLEILDSFDMITRPEDPEDRVEGLGNLRGRININANPEQKGTITELTGITSEMVEQGTPIEQALKQWWEWVSQAGCGYRIADWGGGDLALLAQHSKSRAIYHKRIKGLDIKRVAEPVRQMVNNKATLKGGLKNTLTLFDLPFYGDEHNAYWDAVNTAHLYFYILEKISLGFKLEKVIKPSHSNFLKKIKSPK